MSKIINNEDYDENIKNLRAEGISPYPFITPDFNFSAKFYARWLRWLFANMELNDFTINQLLQRELTTKKTDSIDLKNDGDWTTEFLITLQADVILSKVTTTVSKQGADGTPHDYILHNATKIFPDGVYTPDYMAIIDKLIADNISQENKIKQLQTDLTNLTKVVNDTKNLFDKDHAFIQKVYNNLVDSGGYNGTEDGGTFPDHIATGTINFHSLSKGDQNYLIRTHKGHQIGDYSGGVQ